MPINTDCPSCNRKLRVPDELLGKKVKCPTCGTVFQADETSAAAPYGTADMEEPVTSAPQEESALQEERSAAEEDKDALGPPRSGSSAKPDRVQTIGVMMLISGILGIMIFLGWSGATCCLWPGGYYSLVLGILAIINGARLLGDRANEKPAPKWVAIMMIINIINADIPSLVMGILCLQMLGEPDVERYFPPNREQGANREGRKGSHR